MGCVSAKRLKEIAARAEIFLPELAQAVLKDSERSGFHTAHSLIERMKSVVRRHVLEARRQPIPFPQERKDITEAAPDDIEPPFCLGR